jgi:hypothetical protein
MNLYALGTNAQNEDENLTTSKIQIYVIEFFRILGS